MKKIALYIIIVSLISSCNKDKLNVKPDISLVVPNSVKDYQALLDNTGTMNQTPAYGQIGADNYYLQDARWNSLTINEKNAYIWNEDVFNPGSTVNDWNYPYKTIFCANVVLDGLKTINRDSDQQAYDNAKGSALFFRAHSFYQLAQLFCKPYNALTAQTDLGIPIRLTAAIDNRSVRTSVHETYNQIIQDLSQAVLLLPDNSSYKTRPTKNASLALLARTFLSMGDYDNALKNANDCLNMNATLLDYNQLSTTSAAPIPRYNNEVLFDCSCIGTSTFNTQSSCFIDTSLYTSYAINDLRKEIFYTKSNGLINYKGSYTGYVNIMFSGIANDEMFLTRAECLARKGDITAAMNDLNTLLKKRWKTDTFIPLTANSASTALNIILQERHKELVFRAIRWTDLRRLNLEGRNIILKRIVNNQTITLLPNSNLYTYPIPPLEISVNPMPQNPRGDDVNDLL